MRKKLAKGALAALMGLFSLALLLTVRPSVAGDVEGITAALQKKYEDLDTISAEFAQESFSAALGQTEVSRGTVYFKKPGKMRWDYSGPSKDRLVSNGHILWLYQHDLGQAIERPVSDEPDIARDFLSGVGSLDRDFSIRIEEDRGKTCLLGLEPRKFQPGIKALFIEVDKSSLLVVKTIVEDPFGNRTTVSLENIRLNEPLKDSLFEFVPPEGVRILRP